MQDLDTGSTLVIRLEKLSEMPVDLWKANAPAQDSAPLPETSSSLTMEDLLEDQLEGQEVPVAQQEGQLMVAQQVVQQEDHQVEEQQSTPPLAEEALLTFQLSR